MTMHETEGWLLDGKTVWIALAVWGAAVLLYFHRRCLELWAREAQYGEESGPSS